jgi:hypothetical protein
MAIICNESKVKKRSQVSTRTNKGGRLRRMRCRTRYRRIEDFSCFFHQASKNKRPRRRGEESKSDFQKTREVA